VAGAEADQFLDDRMKPFLAHVVGDLLRSGGSGGDGEEKGRKEQC
jgi:hypothetical protein